MAITDKLLKSKLNVESDNEEILSDGDNLYIKITRKGTITFFMRYRELGKKNASKLTIGRYPVMSLKDARLKVAEYNQARLQGKNPKYELKLIKEKMSGKSRYTVKQLIDLWYEKEGCMKSSGKEVYSSFQYHIFERFGDIYMDDIAVNVWILFLEEIMENAPSIAVRLLTNLKLAQKFGFRRGLIEHFSLQHITPKADLHYVKKSRERNLSDQEIYWLFWGVVYNTRLHPRNGIIVLLTLIYGNRIGELRLARREHFDFDKMLWTVPAENHKTGKKNNRAIVRPIIPVTEFLIRYAHHLIPEHHQYSFGNVKRDEDIPFESRAHLSIPNGVNRMIKVLFDVDMKPWSMHDLRRTMRTHMSEFAPPHVCEVMIGHTLTQMMGVYDHYQYIQEQADGYQAWVNRIGEIIHNHEAFGNNGGKPLSLRRSLEFSQISTCFLKY